MILIDLTHGEAGAIDVAPHLAAMAQCESLDPGDAWDVVDWWRALDPIESEARRVEDAMGLSCGGLARHVAGLA